MATAVTARPIEVIAVQPPGSRDRRRRASPRLPPPSRRAVRGPCVVAEADCTIWVPDGWTGDVGPLGALVLTRAASPSIHESRRDEGGVLLLPIWRSPLRVSRASPTRWVRCYDVPVYSPNIKERADCSAAAFTASGELLVQAEHIPVHLGAMPASVRAGRSRWSQPAGSRCATATRSC